jgi:hypothetical protein
LAGLEIEDLRAWANAEFLERQVSREMKDWHHFSQLDRKFERRFKDPNDVLIDAKRLQEQRTAEQQEVLAEADRIRK